MWTSGAGAYAYQSVRRRSPDRSRRRARRAALLASWLALVIRVVVVGGLAFGGGFLGVNLTRSLGWEVVGNGAGAPLTVAARAPV